MPVLTAKIVPCMFRIMASYGLLLTPMAACPTIRPVSPSIEYRWRGPVSDAEMMTLITAHGGQAVPGWWTRSGPAAWAG